METDKDAIEKLQKQIKLLRAEKKVIQRKLWDINESRNMWKQRYKDLLKNKHSSVDLFSEDAETACGYQYNLVLVFLCARLQTFGSMSLRGVVHILLCLQLSLGSSGKRVPCASTVRSWVSKIGKWRIGSAFDDRESEWVYWVDESIHIGGEKILLVLGIRVSDLPTTTALTMKDMTLLHMSISQSWTGAHIAEVLQDLKKQYKLDYTVSDAGSSLLSAYQIAQIPHIHDCTHFFSNALEKYYKPQEIFNTFSKWANALRSKWVLSGNKKAYLPPKQRTKVRFANLFPIVEWAYAQIAKWTTLPTQVQQEFEFLHKQQEWITQFYHNLTHIKQVGAIIKNEGYTTQTHKEVMRLQKKEKKKVSKELRQPIENYLDRLKVLAGNRKHMVCCSDVIESAFGKLKQKLPRSSTANLTEFIFTLATATGTLTQKDVKDALENIKDKDLKNNLRNDRKTAKKT